MSYRHPKTFSLARYAAGEEVDEESSPVRPKRNRTNLPNAYDDIWSSSGKETRRARERSKRGFRETIRRNFQDDSDDFYVQD